MTHGQKIKKKTRTVVQKLSKEWSKYKKRKLLWKLETKVVKRGDESFKRSCKSTCKPVC